MFVPIAQFKWVEGEQLAKRFELPTAKYFCTGFCSQCGSNMPWLSKRGTVFIVPAGALDEDPQVRPERIVHWASRAPWYVHGDTLQAFDAEPR